MMEFVNWDDNRNPIIIGKCQIHGNQTTNQIAIGLIKTTVEPSRSPQNCPGTMESSPPSQSSPSPVSFTYGDWGVGKIAKAVNITRITIVYDRYIYDI